MLRNWKTWKSCSYINIIQRAFSENLSDVLPRRSTLYVPGDVDRRIFSIVKLIEKDFHMDCVVLDCEDGVAMNRKEEARNLIKKFFHSKLTNTKLANSKIDWAVRVNSVKSGYLDDDIKIMFSGSQVNSIPKTIFLPKVNCKQDLDIFAEIFAKYLSNNDVTEKIDLIFYAESCKAVMDLKDICAHAFKLSDSPDTKFKPAGIVFGSDDFLGSIGAYRNVDPSNILYARQKIVLTAKAFDLQAIDMVHIDYKDDEGLHKISVEGAGLGYTGKQVIHPQQVPIVQHAFIPPKEKINWAIQVLEAYQKHQQRGVGAFVFNNQMIDNPTIVQCRNILKLSYLS